MNEHAAPSLGELEMTGLMQPEAVRDQDEVSCGGLPGRPNATRGAGRRWSSRARCSPASSPRSALVAGPFAGGREPVITGAILLGFAVGWALLAVLSVRFDRPAAALGGGPGRRDGHHRRRAHRPRSGRVR